MKNLGAGAAVLLLAFARPAFAADRATSLSVSTGADYSSGKYGGRLDTDILAEITDVNLKTGDFLFSAALPYLDVTGPVSVVVGNGGVPVAINTKARSETGTRRGIGDLNLGATYSLPSDSLWNMNVDLSGRVKIPTADASDGLSTGKTDFSFSADVSRSFDDFSPFVTLGYHVPQSPAGYTLNNGVSLSAGASVPIGNTLAIFSYDYDGAISKSLAASNELFASESWPFNDQWTVTLYGEKGLSSGAPTAGGGLLISYKAW